MTKNLDASREANNKTLIEDLTKLLQRLEEQAKSGENYSKKLLKFISDILPIDLQRLAKSSAELNATDDIAKSLTALNTIQEQQLQSIKNIIKSRCTNELAEANAIRQLNALYSDLYINNEKPTRFLSFSKTLGKNISIENNKDHLFAKKHTLIHYESNSICTWIPKIGCTNIRYSIPLANGAISTPKDIEWVHNNNNSFSADNKELLKADYTFVFLRNPFNRLVSFFLDKLCHNDPNESDKSYSNAQKIFRASEHTCFQDFVELLWLEPELINADIHTRRQSDFLVYNKYDDYFSLENYSLATKKVYQSTGLKILDTRNMGSGNTTHSFLESADITYETKTSDINTLMKSSKKPNTKNMYSDKMCRMVGILFLPDILLYLKEVENSESEMNYWISKIIYS